VPLFRCLANPLHGSAKPLFRFTLGLYFFLRADLLRLQPRTFFGSQAGLLPGFAARLLFGLAAGLLCFLATAKFHRQPIQLLLETALQIFCLTQSLLFFVAQSLFFRRAQSLGLRVTALLRQSLPASLLFCLEPRALFCFASTLRVQRLRLLQRLTPLLFFGIPSLLCQRTHALLPFGVAPFAFFRQAAANLRLILTATLLVRIRTHPRLDVAFCLALLLRAVNQRGEERIIPRLTASGLYAKRLR
jgi:hypothetical protein